jgi:hypothetical protein
VAVVRAGARECWADRKIECDAGRNMAKGMMEGVSRSQNQDGSVENKGGEWEKKKRNA